MPDTADTAIDMTLELVGSEPPIWRRLYVPEYCVLEDLHDIIQSVMGWLDYHLHEFEVAGSRFGRPDYVDDFWDDDLPQLQDARDISLCEIFEAGIRQFLYRYDFGDDWNITVTLSRSFSPPEPITRAHCVDGARSGPLEDSGGVGGYEEVCRALADPDHEEHEEYIAWVPRGFEPDNFSVAGVDWIVANRICEEDAFDHLVGWLGALPRRLTMTDPCYREMWWTLQRPEITNAEQAGQAARDVRNGCAGIRLHRQTTLTIGQNSSLIAAEHGALPAAMVLNESLSQQDLARVPYLVNTIHFLKLVDAAGEMKATAKGNLPRAFLQEFIGLMVAATNMRKPPSITRCWREEDLWWVHDLRLLLQRAGLLKIRKGKFSLTRRGRELIADGREGALLGHLFRTEIVRLYPQKGDIHSWRAAVAASWGYILNQWIDQGPGWQSAGDLAERLLPRYAWECILKQEGRDALPIILEIYILERLAEFGLADIRQVPDPEGIRRRSCEYRPTPLAARFISFDLDQLDVSRLQTASEETS